MLEVSVSIIQLVVKFIASLFAGSIGRLEYRIECIIQHCNNEIINKPIEYYFSIIRKKIFFQKIIFYIAIFSFC